MRYYLDTEFNGMGGELLSLALVSEAPIGGVYLANKAVRRAAEWSKTQPHIKTPGIDPWVWKNVLPIIELKNDGLQWDSLDMFSYWIGHVLGGDPDPIIVTDWPDDIKYFCQCLITGPGEMIDIPGIKFEVVRVDAYPTDLPGAVQHNAYWDAMALRYKLTGAK